MFGEIKISFGEQTGNIYVALPERDICLTVAGLEGEIKDISREQLEKIVELCQERIKQVGQNAVSDDIKQILNKLLQILAKLEELSSIQAKQKKEKRKDWFFVSPKTG